MGTDYEVQWTRDEFERARQGAVEKALRTLETPISEVLLDYEVEITRTGQEVLDCECLTLEEAIEEPWNLLSGESYHAGSLIALDPFHPATPALVELRFAASAAVNGERPELMRTAVDRAEGFLRASGVPDEVGAVRPRTACASMFEALDILALMPKFQPPLHHWTHPLTWQERAKATYLLMGARTNMPSAHPARPAVDNYVWLLANPDVPPEWMESPALSAQEALSS